MSHAFAAFRALLDGGGLHVMLALLAILCVAGAILVERLSYFGWSLTDRIAPALRRQKVEERRRFAVDFEEYLRAGDDAEAERLVSRLDAVPAPVRDFAAPLLGRSALRPGALAELRVGASERLCRSEARRSLGLLPPLAVAALLLGLVASLGSLSRTLDELAVHGMSDLTAWTGGLERTLLAAEASLVVAGFALLASGALGALARAADEDIRVAALEARRALAPRAGEGGR